jgi:hypothetical protein
MHPRHRHLIAATLLLGCLLGLSATAWVLPTAATTTSCTNHVAYDAFRTDNATIEAAANNSATVTRANTRVRIEQAPGFVRLNASNPNGYCVAFDVTLAEPIVTPAELGTVDALEADVTADWHAVHNFSADQTYTRVTFTLPAASTAAFAPSQARVQTLAWTGAAEAAGNGLLHSLTTVDIPFLTDGSGKLQQRTYHYSPQNSSASTEIVTIPLRNASDGRTISEWHALYRIEDGQWTPVTEDSTQPVFYRTVDETTIQFIFNDQTAEVKFTANPTASDKLSYQLDAYMAGINELTDSLTPTQLTAPRATEAILS